MTPRKSHIRPEFIMNDARVVAEYTSNADLFYFLDNISVDA